MEIGTERYAVVYISSANTRRAASTSGIQKQLDDPDD